MVATTSAAAVRILVRGDFIVLSFAVCSRRRRQAGVCSRSDRVPSKWGRRRMRLGRAATGAATTAGGELEGAGSDRLHGRDAVESPGSSVLSSVHTNFRPFG